MQLRYNFRLYPGVGQQVSLAKVFGCARVVFNDGLAARREAFENGQRINDAELSKRLTESKNTTDRAWLAEVSSVVLRQALADLSTAYRNFFQSIAGKRKGVKVALPRLRSRKDNRQSVEAEQFLILPHPSVLDMYRHKGSDYDRRLAGMRRHQRGLLDEN